MRSLWNGLYDSAKDRRYGTLYLLVSVMIAGFCLGAAFFEQLFRDAPPEFLRVGAAVAAVFFVLMVVRGVLEFRARRRQRRGPNYSQLSSDELAKARSKLRKNENRNRT